MVACHATSLVLRTRFSKCAKDRILVCRGWRIAYNSLLNLHAKSGRADLAEGVYQGMLLQGPSPNKNTVNSTIVAFATVRGSHLVWP